MKNFGDVWFEKEFFDMLMSNIPCLMYKSFTLVYANIHSRGEEIEALILALFEQVFKNLLKITTGPLDCQLDL